MTTNVPALTFSDNGIVAPTDAEIVAGLWLDFDAAFGVTLNRSYATPQGQLVTSLAAIIGAQNDLSLALFNSVDPAFSSGRMQDAIGRLYYQTRIPAQPTTVVATCSGGADTPIPAGSLAKATDGTIYQSVAAAKIPASGSVDVTFAAITTGPIACPAGSLNEIYRLVPGWDSITNAADGVVGRYEETPAEFETRREASVSSNARGFNAAVRGAVLAVNGVIDAYVVDNESNTSATIGGVSVAANSLYVCAYGGTDADVAKAIWTKKGPGCSYTGGTTVTVTDDVTGYSLPLPTYSVKFQRPTAVPLYFEVTIANTAAVPSTGSDAIKAAIVAAYLPKIGATTFGYSFAKPIFAVGDWVQLISIKVGTSASPTTDSVTLDINKIGTVTAANIAVVLV